MVQRNRAQVMEDLQTMVCSSAIDIRNYVRYHLHISMTITRVNFHSYDNLLGAEFVSCFHVLVIYTGFLAQILWQPNMFSQHTIYFVNVMRKNTHTHNKNTKIYIFTDQHDYQQYYGTNTCMSKSVILENMDFCQLQLAVLKSLKYPKCYRHTQSNGVQNICLKSHVKLS